MKNIVRNQEKLYIIKTSNFYKIGTTNNIDLFLENIDSHSPYKTDLIFSETIQNSLEIENKILKRYETKIFKNRWLKLNKKDINLIISEIIELANIEYFKKREKQILNLLKIENFSTKQLSQKLSLSKTTILKSLKQLLKLGKISKIRKGKNIFYSVKSNLQKTPNLLPVRNKNLFQKEIFQITSLLKVARKDENIYFKITEISKNYNKETKEFFKLQDTKKYISYIQSLLFKQNIQIDLFYTKQGKYGGGTWLHFSLMKLFLRWILPTESYAKFELFGVLETIIDNSINKKSVYIIQTEDNRIKIGISANTKRRFTSIENGTGLKIIKSVVTEKLDNSYIIEQTLLQYFQEFRTKGEWLQNIEFNNIVVQLQKQINNYETLTKKILGNKK